VLVGKVIYNYRATSVILKLIMLNNSIMFEV